MNNIHQNKILQTKASLSFQLDGMTDLESNFFREKLFAKYTNHLDHFPIWENIVNRFSVCEKNAWKWLDEFIQLKETYLFFDSSDDPTFYIIHENQSITQFLAELPFVFYLTNENLDFLITQNDHDYLIASGTAESWLRDKAKELSKSGWVDMDGKSYL